MKKLDLYNRRYLGSKQRLLNFIHESIEKECGNFDSLIDIFAGTGAVAYSFNDNHKVIVNDLLKSNYFAYQVWMGNGKIDSAKVEHLIESYNERVVEDENYFSETFAETYFSEADTKKIGFIRQNIDDLFNKNIINEDEKSYLITSLIYSADRIANTVGHYDAYRKIGKLQDRFVMYPLSFSHENNEKNEIYCENANDLIKRIQGDILYIDPPYNSRQYCDAYHLLENLACWEKPRVSGVALKMDRTSIKSSYCGKKALGAFTDLIENADVKYIVVSYNNMYEKGAGRSQAILKESDIIGVLSKKGRVVVYEKDFQAFTTGKSNIDNHKERLYICHVDEKDTKAKVVATDSERFVKSPLNYTGGKFKIIKDLDKIFPEKVKTFIDMFCGGANVAINAKAEKIVGYDSFSELIELLNYLKGKTYIDINAQIEQVINEYCLSDSCNRGYEFYGCSSSEGLGKYNREGYKRLKDYYNSSNCKNKPLCLLVLIIYGFNNQIRFNGKQQFNIPVGKRDYNSAIRKNLNRFICRINSLNIDFKKIDFRDLNIDELDENDFVYLDPPYLLGCATYNESNGWTEKDEKDLYELLLKLDKKNIKFALSNVIEHKGKIHHLLNEFAIENRFNINFIDRNYDNASYHVKNKGENTTCEVVITNYKI